VKNIKFAVLACGVLGLIACFLPFASFGDMKITFWDGHKGPDGVQTYLVMAGYALGAVMGAIGVAQGLKRPQAIAAAIGFAFVIFKFRGVLSEMLKAAIGGKLLFVAAVAGLVVSVIAAAKPEEG
jgi:predicted alpha/beta hydrolase